MTEDKDTQVTKLYHFLLHCFFSLCNSMLRTFILGLISKSLPLNFSLVSLPPSGLSSFPCGPHFPFPCHIYRPSSGICSHTCTTRSHMPVRPSRNPPPGLILSSNRTHPKYSLQPSLHSYPLLSFPLLPYISSSPNPPRSSSPPSPT